MKLRRYSEMEKAPPAEADGAEYRGAREAPNERFLPDHVPRSGIDVLGHFLEPILRPVRDRVDVTIFIAHDRKYPTRRWLSVDIREWESKHSGSQCTSEENQHLTHLRSHRSNRPFAAQNRQRQYDDSNSLKYIFSIMISNTLTK